MKQNIFLMGEDLLILKNISNLLCEEFDMREFDAQKMLEFEIIPYSLEEFKEKCGEEKLIKKIKSILKMECDFAGCICAFDYKYYDNVKDVFEKIKENNFVIFVSSKQVLNEEFDLTIKVNKNKIDINLLKDEIVQKIKDIYGL